MRLAKFVDRAAAAIVWIMFPGLAAAQNSGVAEIGLQGYYLSHDTQRVSDISGLALNFRNFIPNVGLLSGSFEGYGGEGQLRYGDNFLQLRGFPWGSQRWTFTGGDFHVSTDLVDFPFHNLFRPEISARGVKIEASRQDRQYTFFLGGMTLQQGPRVPFRIRVPQTALGASLRQKLGDRLEIGARFLRLTTGESENEQNLLFFPSSRDFRLVDSVSIQTKYVATKNLKLHGEVTSSDAKYNETATPSGSDRWSYLGGAVWDSPLVTARANYAHQTAAYLPLIGYFVGDRRGPFGEIHLRPNPRINLYGSASHYVSNLEHNPDAPTFRSSAQSMGTSVTLPWRFTTNAQLSTVRFSSRSSDSDVWRASDNRHLLVNLARPIQHHNLRLTLSDIKLTSEQGRQKQRSAEIEDLFQSKHLTLGGAVRLQNLAADQRRNTVFGRGSVQGRLGRLSVHAYLEIGSDMVNRTVFATNSLSTTVIGVTAPLGSSWSLHLESFRNRLSTQLNPESVFVLANRGLAPQGSFESFNQWSVYFRVVKTLRWGSQLLDAGTGTVLGEQIPLFGAVEGFVVQRLVDGTRPASGIPVTLGNSRTVISDAQGRFRIVDVPEGEHRVMLAKLELPADYDPGPVHEATVRVGPKRTTRVDLDVIPLTSVEGKVSAPADFSTESLLVRLSPIDRYTTPDVEGTFAFHSLPEGDYEVYLDPATMPADALATPPHVGIAVRIGTELPPVQFEIEVRKPEKPVRIIELAGQQMTRDAGIPETPKAETSSPASSGGTEVLRAGADMSRETRSAVAPSERVPAPTPTVFARTSASIQIAADQHQSIAGLSARQSAERTNPKPLSAPPPAPTVVGKARPASAMVRFRPGNAHQTAMRPEKAQGPAALPAIPRARFAVQVATFRNRSNADRFVQVMKRRYGVANIILHEGNTPLWLVLVGNEPTREVADSLERKIRSDSPPGVIGSVVVRMRSTADTSATGGGNLGS